MSNMRTNCCFLLFDGFSNMVLANALEPLRAARDLPNGPAITWSIATTTGETAQSSSGIEVSADTNLDALAPVDFLFIVAGYGFHDQMDPSSLAKLQRLRRKSKHVVGLDAGAWLMALGGLLDGHSATIHWQEIAAFRETFPMIDVVDQNVVFSGAMITCGDAGAVFETLLGILRGAFGDGVAFDVSNLFIFDHNQRPMGRTTRAAGSDILRAAVRTMSTHIEAPMSLDDIAVGIGVSLSTLNRTFQRELNATPGAHYRGLRLDHARRLAIETTLPNIDIAQRSGFGSASVLCRAFAMQFGTTITDTRVAHRGR